jgi:hypothetical protein
MVVQKGKEIKISELMKEIIGRWFWYLPVVAIVCFVFLYFHQSIVYSGIIAIACVNVVVETVILVVVSSILGKRSMLTSVWGITYLATIVGEIFLINFLTSPMYSENIGILALSVFILFGKPVCSVPLWV